jgi:predicted GNAT superfamily acetyltransferase
MPEVRIRPLREAAEYEACVDIQRRVWRHADLDVTPVHQFCIAAHTGAILLGAFVDGTISGYVYSFPAVVGGKVCHHSHHLAVLPEFQGRGLGKKLKWAQREEAARRGLDLITWTFDPLQARNANLNIHVLGAAGGTYLRNFYGGTPALTLDTGVPTDRLMVEWPIRSARVKARQAEASEPFDPANLPKAVERRPGGVFPEIEPRRVRLSLDAPRILVEIPEDIRVVPRGTGRIAAWQTAVRAALEAYFSRGYRLDDFVSGDPSYYVLKRGRRSP